MYRNRLPNGSYIIFLFVRSNRIDLALDSNRDLSIGESETFSLAHNADGSFSLKSNAGLFPRDFDTGTFRTLRFDQLTLNNGVRFEILEMFESPANSQILQIRVDGRVLMYSNQTIRLQDVLYPIPNITKFTFQLISRH